jgi:hypothetical protein
MTCPHCGAENEAGAKFCSQCGASFEADPAPQEHEAMGGAEALAIAGEKETLWGRDQLAGYAMDKRALDELQDEGKGDSDAANIARRGMNIAIAYWVGGGVVFLIVLIIILSHLHSQPSTP